VLCDRENREKSGNLVDSEKSGKSQKSQGKVREFDLWSGKKFKANFYTLFVVNSSQAKK